MSRAREIADLVGGPTPDIILKTADGAILNLQTSDTTVTDGSVLGAINFTAPNEGSGTDSILVGAVIQAEAEGTFSASNNATSIVFKTAASAAAGTAAGLMTFTSGGELILKDTDTADGSSPTITLQTGDTDIAANDVLGSINFQAPDEGAGTDAILVAAGIRAVSEGDFSSSNNATSLQFLTGASETATEQVTIDSAGHVVINNSGTSDGGFLTIQTGNTHPTAPTFMSTGTTQLFLKDTDAASNNKYWGFQVSGGSLNIITCDDNRAGGFATPLEFTQTDVKLGTGADFITNTAGTSSLRIGVNAGNSITSGGNYNVFVGDEAGTATTSGNTNVGVGFNALLNSVAGDSQVAVGTNALATHNADGASFNVAVGHNSLNTLTTAGAVTAVGGESGLFCSTGQSGTFVGFRAAKGITGTPLTGAENTAVGREAGLLLQGAATQNTIVGAKAADALTTGSYNVILGVNAAGTSTTGDQNIVIGQGSCGTGVLVGDRNVVIGDSAGQAITSAAGNVVIGAGACSSTADINGEVPMQTATNCVILGNKAQVSAQNADSQHCIGLEVIGNGNNTFTFGKAGTDTSIAFSNGAISNPSDQRYKEDIVTSTAGLSFIKDLRPVTFKWKKEKDIPSDHREYVEGSNTRVQLSTGEINHGFIAQEVKAVIDAHSEIKDGFSMWSEQGETGGRQRLSPTALIPMLVKAIQELEARIATLEG